MTSLFQGQLRRGLRAGLVGGLGEHEKHFWARLRRPSRLPSEGHAGLSQGQGEQRREGASPAASPSERERPPTQCGRGQGPVEGGACWGFPALPAGPACLRSCLSPASSQPASQELQCGFHGAGQAGSAALPAAPGQDHVDGQEELQELLGRVGLLRDHKELELLCPGGLELRVRVFWAVCRSQQGQVPVEGGGLARGQGRGPWGGIKGCCLSDHLEAPPQPPPPVRPPVDPTQSLSLAALPPPQSCLPWKRFHSAPFYGSLSDSAARKEAEGAGSPDRASASTAENEVCTQDKV